MLSRVPVLRPCLVLLTALAALACLASSAAAKRVKLKVTSGLPPNAARDIAAGPGGEVWVTSDQPNGFVARISAKGKVLQVVRVPGRPDSIARGPDGAMWTTLRDIGAVARVTRGGQVTTFPVPLPPGSEPRRIVAGPDGALWVTLFRASAVGRLTTGGAWSIFSAGLMPGGEQLGLSRGPGGLWLTEPRGDRILRLNAAGAVTGSFQASNAGGPEDIAQGFDGNMWFTEDDGDRIGKVTPAGKVTEYSAGITPGGSPFNIVSGPDDAMWFTEADGNRVGRATPDGHITEYDLPAGVVPRRIILGPGRKLWLALAGTGQVGRFTPPLAPVTPADLGYAYTTQGGTSRFTRLEVEGLPPGGAVVARCSGGGCPARSFTKKGKARVDLRGKFGRLRPGASLQIRMVATGYATKVRIFKASRSGLNVETRCIAPRTKTLRKGCG